MKKRWREKLPNGVRKFFRRLIVRLVKASAPVAKDVLNIAASNGLDVESTFGLTPKTNNDLKTSVKWDTADFLFLMDLLGKRQNEHGAANTLQTTASIVMLALNEVDHSFNCLRTLLREVDLSVTEIIVVNNGSTDDTARMLSYFQDFIKVIHNPENFGFVGGCNQGAEIANGKYVVFLNNDTIVQPGWLTHLIETADNDPSVGAVGSMLIYPDGSLQEAGAIIWRDGSATKYGHGLSPEDNKVSYAREVDYCSGASLLVRKDLFDKLGGFDQIYSPAYYEDVDMCFGLRSLGYKVIYQPKSRLIHHEGATGGTDVQRGFKRFQVINHGKFVEKWREVLSQDYWEYSPESLDRAANRRVAPYVPPQKTALKEAPAAH